MKKVNHIEGDDILEYSLKCFNEGRSIQDIIKELKSKKLNQHEINEIENKLKIELIDVYSIKKKQLKLFKFEIIVLLILIPILIILFYVY